MIPRYIKGRSNIVLVDYSLNNLDIIRSEYPREPLALIAADANKLPFKTGSFDSGISIRLIQNVFSAEPLLGELSRVLRTRAYFVFSYFNRRNLLRVLRYGGQSLRRVHSVAFGDMCGTHPLFFRRLVEKEHLTIKAGRGTGFFYQVTRPLKPLQRLVAKSGPAARAILTASNAFDKVMGALNLSLWQFVLMEKEGPEPSEVPAKRLLDLLACPACGSGGIEETAEACRCGACGGSYPKRNGIYDFRIGRSAPAA
jgi:SAM-dependent methyltransferase